MKFNDIKALIFDGYLKETLTFGNDFIIVIRTLCASEESFIVETYKDLHNDYNLLAAMDTVQRSIYSINGCKINDCREKIKDWPKQVIIKVFEQYLKLMNRYHNAIKLINDFVKTDDSRLYWSVLKATKSSLNSAVITGNPEFESKGISYIQQIWIYLNQQEDLLNQNKIDWARVEYMTDSICAFVNPKAMQQIQNKKRILQEEQLEREERAEIQKNENGKIMIENTADELFDALVKRPDESILDRNSRVQQILTKAFVEDEHDRIVREHEEYQFYKELRIKKENVRRAKILHEKKLSNAIVINLPEAPKGINVGFIQVSTLGDDVVAENIKEEMKSNKYFINGVDYSDIVTITSFSMLKNKDSILNEVANESDETTTNFIEQYIKEEEDQKTEVMKIIESLKNPKITDSKERVLNMRDSILTNKSAKNKFENEQENMISQIKQQNLDEIHMEVNHGKKV